jgi:hypothetical protein
MNRPTSSRSWFRATYFLSFRHLQSICTLDKHIYHCMVFYFFDNVRSKLGLLGVCPHLVDYLKLDVAGCVGVHVEQTDCQGQESKFAGKGLHKRPVVG